jgi:hypothetical protein
MQFLEHQRNPTTENYKTLIRAFHITNKPYSCANHARIKKEKNKEGKEK